MANEIIIEGDNIKVALRGKGKFYGYALASLCDIEIVSSVSWTINAQGYVVGRHKPTKKVVKMNRLILLGAENNPSIVDHISRDKLDNRRENLRITDASGNAKNTSIARNNTSGAKGVSRSFNGTRWRARIWIGRREIHLGVFDSKEEAEQHYDDAAELLHGEFASPNSVVKPSAHVVVKPCGVAA